MNDLLTSPTTIRSLLEQIGRRPNKRLGQNFLADAHYVDKICALLGPIDGAEVLEIGPGLGALTQGILARGATITAIEVDPPLVDLERELFAGRPFRVIGADALTVDWGALFRAPQAVHVASNIPYAVSGPLLFKLLTSSFPHAVVMVQREVAERLAAPVGTRQRGSLTVVAEASWAVRKCFDVPASAFYPRPDVVSSVLQLTRTASTPPRAWMAFVRSLFRYRRKMIRSGLKEALGISSEEAIGMALEAGLDATRRPETLSVDEFTRLFRAGGERYAVQESDQGDLEF